LVAEIISFPKIIFGEHDMINHKDTYADLVRFLSQRGRMLMLITVYQSLAQLHKGRSGAPLRALAKALGVSRSQAHNYLNGHSIPDDVTVRLVGLIKEDRRAYFIQDIAAMILALAKAFSQYYRPHQFDFHWHLPDIVDQKREGVGVRGLLKIRYEFVEPPEDISRRLRIDERMNYLVFTAQGTFGKHDVLYEKQKLESGKVSRFATFKEEKYLVVGQKALGDVVPLGRSS
jgi:hypothetical protein